MRDFIMQMHFQLDKSTYYSVIGAMLSIYGIFLACIQFIAGSENSNSEEVSQYMGINIRAFYLNYCLKTVRVAKSFVFEIMMGYCVLFKPTILTHRVILHPHLSEKLIYDMRKSYYYVGDEFITYIFVYSCKYTLALTSSLKAWIKERILRTNANDCKTIDEYIDKIQKILIKFDWSLSLGEMEHMRAFFFNGVTK